MKKFNWEEFKDKNNNIAEDKKNSFLYKWCLEYLTYRYSSKDEAQEKLKAIIGEDNFKKYILEITDKENVMSCFKEKIKGVTDIIDVSLKYLEKAEDVLVKHLEKTEDVLLKFKHSRKTKKDRFK